MRHDHDAEEAPRIGLAEAKGLFDTGQATFVDVRPPDKFAQSHIPSAMSMPLAQIPRRYHELPRDGQLVFY